MFKAPPPHGWKRTALDHLAEVQTGIAKGKTINGTVVTLPYLRVANVQDGHVDISTMKQMTLKPSEVERYSLRAGDVLFTEGGDFDKLGRGAVWTGEIEPCLHQNHVFAVRPSLTRLLPEFLAFQAASEYGRRYFQLSSKQSTNLASINSTQLKQFPVLLPPLLEQRKIAEILRTWDEAIEKASKLIELRRAQYRTLREDLINWTTEPREQLQTLIEPVSRPVARPNEPYRAISIRSHGKGTFIRLVADPASIGMDTLYTAYEGDLLVNITFAWEGAIALVPAEHHGCLVSHRFPAFVPISSKVSARYLRHTLRMPRFTYLLALVSPGGAGRNRVLNKSDFLALEVPAPELRTQQLIASSLDAVEEVIGQVSALRDALTRQKRGLMQKLLTGEWRVKVESDKEAAA